jgi:hypothetical protein
MAVRLVPVAIPPAALPCCLPRNRSPSAGDPGRYTAELLTESMITIFLVGLLALAILQFKRSVRVADAKVGSVITENVDPRGRLAIVGFDVSRDIKLPTDRATAIASSGIIEGEISVAYSGRRCDLHRPSLTAETSFAVDLACANTFPL